MTDVTNRTERLYELLPVVYRQRDADQGFPLRDLLRVIAGQVNVVEDDIAGLYENWFIETCDDWVVPYIGDLVGYTPAHAAGEAGDVRSEESRARNRILAPRRDLANFIRSHRRRGTLALLEMLAEDVAGVPAHAIEFRTLMARFQSLNHLLPERGRAVDIREMEPLALLDGPFDSIAHSADLRGVNGERGAGRFNIPNAATWIWRTRAYPITHAPAYFLQRGGGYFFYTFSALGHDAPIFTNAKREDAETSIAAAVNVPAPISRIALDKHLGDYYGPGKSFTIWKDDPENPVPIEDIIPADLSDWKYRPPAGKVVVDPHLGRFVFADAPHDVWVTYRYGFSADIGGGEYQRTLTQPRDAVIYRVGEGEQFATISEAAEQWTTDGVAHAVIEIADSGIYVEEVSFDIPAQCSLQLRAANRHRPVISLLDRHPACGEALAVTLHERSRFTLDGIVVAGRPVQVAGAGSDNVEARVAIRHCTLVPGWTVGPHCEPDEPAEASLDIVNLRGRVTIDKTILGTIAVSDRTIKGEPLRLELRDSILDSTDDDLEAVTAPGPAYADANATFIRCTVIGTVLVHAIDLAENSIFTSTVHVVRRQHGCVRFCYVPPGSRTPRRYHCQPDLAKEHITTPALRTEREMLVAPRFNSLRYGRPDYCQLADDCPAEIAGGADDQAEMGAFHDLFQPQRKANLRARLDDDTPAGMETGILYAD
jgi:hypothetical protein